MIVVNVMGTIDVYAPKISLLNMLIPFLLATKQNSNFSDKYELSSTNDRTSNDDHSPQQD